MHDLVGALQVGGIHLRPECLLVVRIEPPLFYVSDDAYDLRQPSQGNEIQALPDRVLIAKKLSRKNIVNDNYMLRTLTILSREKPPALQGNSHYLQIVFLNDVTDSPAHVALARRFRLAFQPEEFLIVARKRHSRPGKRHRLHSWSRAKLALNLPQGRANRVGAGISHRGWEGNSERQYVVRIEAGIHAPERVQAADHQACRNQQHQRHGHFHDDENSLRALFSATGPAAAFFQRILQIRLRNSQRRRQTKQNSAEQHDPRRKQQNFPINPDFARARQSGGKMLKRHFRSPRRQHQAESASRNCEQHALRQELTYDSAPARSQCRADSKFTVAPHRTRHHQVSHVDASDQENKSDGSEQHQQQSLHISNHLFHE